MGIETAPTMASPIFPTIDQINTTCNHQGGPNKQHSICQTNSNTMFRSLTIWNWGIQQQQISMTMDNSIRMAQETNTDTIIIFSIRNINIHDYPTTDTSLTHLGIHVQLQHTRLDAQGIF